MTNMYTWYYYSIFTVFAVIIVAMAVDPNVATYIDLRFRYFVVQVKKRYYILTLGAMIKFQNWKLKREMKKILKEHEDTNKSL